MPEGPGLAPSCLREALVAVPSLQGDFHDPEHNGRLGVEDHRLQVSESLYFQESPGVVRLDGGRNLVKWVRL